MEVGKVMNDEAFYNHWSFNGFGIMSMIYIRLKPIFCPLTQTLGQVMLELGLIKGFVSHINLFAPFTHVTESITILNPVFHHKFHYLRTKK